ncbi:MAG: hypothetical protein QF833_02835 [Alphaproteobacteria bacterium]|nr:hypothetical protein [Alphaproteobacteria bacterium]
MISTPSLCTRKAPHWKSMTLRDMVLRFVEPGTEDVPRAGGEDS